MGWKVSFFAIIFLTGAMRAAGDSYGMGARAVGMGSSVAVPDFWSVWNNQAGMAFLEGSGTGVYAEDRFLLGELGSQGLAAVWCGRPGAFGLSVRRSGGRIYGEWTAGLAYARKFGRRFSAGLLLDYQLLKIGEGYGSAGTVSFEAGFMYRPDDGWTVAFHCANPVPLFLSENRLARLPVILLAGFSREFEGKLLLAAELEKELTQKPRLRVGAEYQAGRITSLRAGVTTSPWLISAGVGIKAARLQFDLSVSYHTVLGYSPRVCITYLFGNKKAGHEV